MSSESSQERPMRVSLHSLVAGSRPPRAVRGQGDVLVDNHPFNREYHLAVCRPDGSVIYDLPARCEPRGAVAVPVDGRGNVALIRQWRPILSRTAAESTYPLRAVDAERRGTWSWEVPRGFPNGDESGAEAARREAQEETGLPVLSVRPLGWSNFNNSVLLTDQPIFTVLVDVNSGVRAEHDSEGEEIVELKWFSVDSLRHMVLRGQLRCGITLGALSYVFAAEERLHEQFSARSVPKSGGGSLGVAPAQMMEAIEAFENQMWEWGIGARDARLDGVLLCASPDAQQEALAEFVERGTSQEETAESGDYCTWTASAGSDGRGSPLVDPWNWDSVRVEIEDSARGCAHIFSLKVNTGVSSLTEERPSLAWKLSADKTRASLESAKLVVIFTGEIVPAR